MPQAQTYQSQFTGPEIDERLTASGVLEQTIANPGDIAAVDGKLQLADREYDAENPDGLGYKILRKDATFAEQVTATNTIYEIRYDFDLDGDSVEIPAGCVLKFVGGMLGNGSVVFSNTSIDAPRYKIFDVSISGIINNSYVFPEWFGAIADNTTDCTSAFRAAVSLRKDVLLGGGEYYCASAFTMSLGSGIRGEFYDSVIRCNGINLVQNVNLHNFTIAPKDITTPYLIKVSTHDISSYFLRVNISDIRVRGIANDNIATDVFVFEADSNDSIKGMYGAYISNIQQDNKVNRGVVFSSLNVGATEPWMNTISFDNCFFNGAKKVVECVVDTENTRYNCFSDIQFHNFRAQYNTGFSEGFIYLTNCQKFIFDNCFCFDSGPYFKPYFLKKFYCRFQVINSAEAEYSLIDGRSSGAQDETLICDHINGIYTGENVSIAPLLKMRPITESFDIGSQAPVRPGVIPSYWGGYRVFRFLNYTGMSDTRKDALLGVDSSGFPICASNKSGSNSFSPRPIYSDAFVPRSNAASLPNLAGKTYGSMLYNTTLRIPLFADLDNGRWLTAYGARVTSNITKLKGTTADRTSMTLYDYNEGLLYYDTSLKKYVMWNGSAWVNVDGSALS